MKTSEERNCKNGFKTGKHGTQKGDYTEFHNSAQAYSPDLG